MGEEYNTHGRKNVGRALVGNPEPRLLLQDPGVDKDT